MNRLINVFGLSNEYAAAAWLSNTDHKTNGALLADQYCRRFGITPKQQNEITRRYGCTLRIYDNGGRSMDRYTMIPPRWTADQHKDGRHWSCVFSGLDPRGMSGHGMADPGPHLGRRIAWSELPAAVQALARSEWPEFCPPLNLAHTA